MIPALYLLGRELYDRRTGLIAAAFGTVSPLLIWYAQEARMYAFVTLFGLLALLTQLRVDPQPDGAATGRSTSSPPRRCCGRTTSACC